MAILGTYRVPRLQENSPGPRKLAHQALAAGEAGHNTTGRDALHNVLGVPGDEVAVVHDVLLAVREVLADDGAKGSDPQQADARHFVDPEALAREHGLAQPLALVVLDHALRAGDVGVLADAPRLVAVQADCRHVAQHAGREQHLAGADESGMADFAASDHALQVELVLALERDRGRHGDKHTGFRIQGAAHGQLQRDDAVGVAVADAV